MRSLVRARLRIRWRRIAADAMVGHLSVLGGFNLGVGWRRIAADAMVRHRSVFGSFDIAVFSNRIATDPDLGPGRAAPDH